MLAKVLNCFWFLSHLKGNFSMVFFQASLRQNYHFTLKVSKLWMWMGPNGEPIRSIFTLEWKLHPTSQIISHSGIPIEDFISRFSSSIDPPFIFLHPKYVIIGNHRRICSRKNEIGSHVWYFLLKTISMKTHYSQ